jgi:hypothetical protein
MSAPKPPTRRVKAGKSGHRYIVDRVNYKGRGVTTLLGAGMPKPALIGWAARVTAEAAVYGRDEWLPLAEKGREKAALAMLNEARWETTNEAAVRGTDVHKLAERLAAGEEVEVDERTEGFVDSYLAFRDDLRPTDEIAERMIVNRTHVYAGTFDLIATLEGLTVARYREAGGSVADIADLDRPVRLLVDYKTGKRAYPEVCLQLAAYRNGEIMVPVDGQGDEEPVPEVDGCAVLNLAGDGTYDLRPVEAGEREFRTFLYVAQVAAMMEKDDGWGETVIGRSIRVS